MWFIQWKNDTMSTTPMWKKVEINDIVYNKVNEVLKNKASKIKKNIPFKVGDLKITISDDKSISYIDDSCICNKKDKSSLKH